MKHKPLLIAGLALFATGAAYADTVCAKGKYYDSATDACIDCPIGTYNDVEGAVGLDACKTIPPGYYGSYGQCDVNGTDAVGGNCCANRAGISQLGECDKGGFFYCPGGAEKRCKCRTGYRTNKTAVPTSYLDCSVCTAGYGMYDGVCKLCAKGTYGTAYNTEPCKTCPEGETTDGTGAQYCVCAAGYTGSSCTPCEKGTYKTGTGSGTCTACGENMTTDTTGATAASACKCIDGYELLDGKCVPTNQPCADGYTELHTGNGLVFKAWATQTTEHAIVLQRAGSDVQCYVKLVAGAADNAINVSIDGVVYHTSD